jgi:hypothetical protein
MLEHGLGAPGGAAQQGADAGLEFVQIVGLEHIVVGPRIEAADAILHGIARGGHEYGRTVMPRAGATQHLQSVELGQAQIEQHEVIVLGAPRGVGHRAVAHPVHGVAFAAQGIEHAFADHHVVFNEQQSHGLGMAGWMWGIVPQPRVDQA